MDPFVPSVVQAFCKGDIQITVHESKEGPCGQYWASVLKYIKIVRAQHALHCSSFATLKGWRVRSGETKSPRVEARHNEESTVIYFTEESQR